MKKILSLILLLVVISGSIIYRSPLLDRANAQIYQSPCDTPKHIRAGTIDSRFAISRTEYIQSIKEAATTWERVYGKAVFLYDPEAALPINLLYDSRQALNSQLGKENSDLQQKDEQLKPEIAEHQRKALELQRRIDQLNADIVNWNAKGGAPEGEYNRLVTEQQKLRDEADALNDEARSLSVATQQYNTDVQQFNNTVQTYNQALEVRPEGGVYVRDEAGEHIDVYIYSTSDELLNILSHELGHSLGMLHVSDSHAIMSPKTNSVTAPTLADKNALKIACQKRNVVKEYLTNLRERIILVLHQIQT